MNVEGNICGEKEKEERRYPTPYIQQHIHLLIIHVPRMYLSPPPPTLLLVSLRTVRVGGGAGGLFGQFIQ